MSSTSRLALPRKAAAAVKAKLAGVQGWQSSEGISATTIKVFKAVSDYSPKASTENRSKQRRLLRNPACVFVLQLI